MMKRVFKLATAASLVVAMSACSTIHFTNGQKPAGKQTMEQWHHTFVFGLVEGSSPIDLKTACKDGDWNQVTTKVTFMNGLAGMVDGLLIGVDLWQPWTAQYTCS